jgi:hypothetical protein
LFPTAAAVALSGCITARMHEQGELNAVGLRCGFALGEVFQDDEENKLLFVIRQDISATQRACVVQWARRNGLKPVIVDNLQFKAS